MNLHRPLILAALALSVAQARPPAKTPIIIDHGAAGTPTARVDLDAIAASQQNAYAALRRQQERMQAAARERMSRPAADVLSAGRRSELPSAGGALNTRALPPTPALRHLPQGTHLYFFQAGDPRALERLKELPPHTEAYCVDYESIGQVLKLTEKIKASCRIQPLSGDELPQKLGVVALPALVSVTPQGGLMIAEGH